MTHGRRALVVGAGAVGARAARQLAGVAGVAVAVHDVDAHRVDVVVESLGPPATAGSDDSPADVAVLATPPGPDHVAAARALAGRGVAVVSVADAAGTVDALLGLHAAVPVVAGAAFSPGLSCLLAAHAAATFETVEAIEVARAGAGGPACQRQRRAALAAAGARGLVRRRGPSELWFPPPVGRLAVGPADLAEPGLLARRFPGVPVDAVLAASPVARVAAALPPLRRPSGDGPLGAVRVEVRGRTDGGAEATVVYGAVDRPAVAAGAVAAEAALAVLDGRVGPGPCSLADLDPLPVLRALAARGVKAAAFGPAVPGPSVTPAAR